jgi:hypothetical protein
MVSEMVHHQNCFRNQLVHQGLMLTIISKCEITSMDRKQKPQLSLNFNPISD